MPLFLRNSPNSRKIHDFEEMSVIFTKQRNVIAHGYVRNEKYELKDLRKKKRPNARGHSAAPRAQKRKCTYKRKRK